MAATHDSPLQERTLTVSKGSGFAPRLRTPRALAVVVVASLIGALLVASPLWIAIVFGIVMAISAHRPHEQLSRKVGPKWAAGAVTLAGGLVLAGAGTFLVVALTSELMKVVAHLERSSGSLSGLVGPRAANALTEMGFDTGRLYAWLQHQAEAAASFVAATAAVAVRTTAEAVFGLVVALLTMYYVLVEGPALAERVVRIAPLEPRHTRALMSEAREVGRTAFIGTVITAIIQGVLAGIGYAVLGVPQPVLWAVVTTVASFLPIVGTLLVWVPMSGYLLMDGHPVRAVILVAWGILVVTSLADYVIRPRIVGGRGQRHPLLTLISLLGGIELFGLAGLIIAPIVMSVAVAALRLYEREAT